MAVRKCDAKLRRNGVVERCGLKVEADKCPERAEHMLPFVTGFCHSGWHEGFKIDKPTCKYFATCPCRCHEDLWVMFSLGEMERILVDNSTWRPEGTFHMLTRDERVQETVLTRMGASVLQIVDSEPGVLPAIATRDYAPTTTGRAARGELEAWVRQVTDHAVLESESCTPQTISAEVARTQGLGRAPSTGAVDAVLKRWEAIGFAVIGRKPTRFVSYTERGIKFGLDFLKAHAKLISREKD